MNYLEKEFITHTMAEIYLKQGHLKEALYIYKRLCKTLPQDGRTKKRYEMLLKKTLSESNKVIPQRVKGGKSIGWISKKKKIEILQKTLENMQLLKRQRRLK
jgi:hypothetical protein